VPAHHLRARPDRHESLEAAMARVLVVHHDLDVGDQEVDSLRRLGYDVRQCTGPSSSRCPILSGQPCELAAECDVLVYDSWASGDTDGARELITRLREIHADKPIVLTSPGLELDWVEEAGAHDVTPLIGQPTGARLHEAIQAALRGAGGEPV
jgi:DNA-binding response OmpR family regulator